MSKTETEKKHFFSHVQKGNKKTTGATLKSGQGKD